MNDSLEDKDLRNLLRAHDPDRYISTLFASHDIRNALMTLYAFSVELARIPDIVSEPALGEIRLQWWRDVLEEDQGEASAPLADALLKVLDAHGLPIPLIQGMIDARSADLDGGGFKDLPALKAYLYKSEGAVFELSARIAGCDAAVVPNAAKDAAVAYGLVRLMRNVPRDAPAGRVMFPLSMLEDASLEPEEMLAGQGADKLRIVFDSLATEIRNGLLKFREQASGVEGVPKVSFAPLACVEAYLARLLKPSHDPFYDMVDINPLVRFLKIWRAA